MNDTYNITFVLDKLETFSLNNTVTKDCFDWCKTQHYTHDKFNFTILPIISLFSWLGLSSFLSIKDKLGFTDEFVNLVYKNWYFFNKIISIATLLYIAYGV